MIHFTGVILGAIAFLMIGVFHPIVIKGEYYFGTKIWWIFLVAGIIAIAGSLFVPGRLNKCPQDTVSVTIYN